MTAAVVGERGIEPDLLRDLHGRVLRTCRRRWGSARCGISAEDIAQEAMLAAHLNAGGLTGVDLQRYVSGIVAHKVNDARRLAGTREQHERPKDVLPEAEPVSSAADQVLAALEQDEFIAALAPLHPRHLHILGLRYVLGFSVAEVAELLSTSEGAVKVATNRATAAARRLLEGRKR